MLVLARENHLEERTFEDMILLDRVFTASNELRAVMKSPVIREGKKWRILNSLLQNRLHPLNMGYIQIVVRKQRASLLAGISRAFQLLYKEYMGIEPVLVTTASKLDESLRKRAMEVAASLSEKQIEFSEAVDPGIIGGFILNIGDLQYDASIRSRLTAIKKQLNV